MITFENFLIEPDSPIYRQIILHIKRGVVSGTVADGDELPSRRVLSALLGVNPNTVQKAYRLLEDEGLIHSRTGSGSYMHLSEEDTRAIRAELLEEDARRAVHMLRGMGVTLGEALELMKNYWQEGEK